MNQKTKKLIMSKVPAKVNLITVYSCRFEHSVSCVLTTVLQSILFIVGVQIEHIRVLVQRGHIDELCLAVPLQVQTSQGSLFIHTLLYVGHADGQIGTWINLTAPVIPFLY